MGQEYGIKWGTIGNMLGNTLWAQGTCWKLEGNIIRTSREHIENNQSPTPSPKDLFFLPLGCMLPHLIGCRIFSCLSMFFLGHCWPRLMLGAWTMGISNPQMDSAGSSFPNCQTPLSYFSIRLFWQIVKSITAAGLPKCASNCPIFLKKFLSCPRPECFRVYNVPRLSFSFWAVCPIPALGPIHLLRKRWMMPRHTFWGCPLKALCPVLHMWGLF